MPHCPAPETALPPADPVIVEPVYSVQEIAAAWKLSVDTIRSLFLDEPGLIIIQAPRRRGVRTYKTVRVPESVVHRVWSKLQQRHRNN